MLSCASMVQKIRLFVVLVPVYGTERSWIVVNPYVLLPDVFNPLNQFQKAVPDLDTSRRFLDPVVVSRLKNMELRARLIVEGFITGLHRSPYHGFSVEFAEHRPYNTG